LFPFPVIKRRFSSKNENKLSERPIHLQLEERAKKTKGQKARRSVLKRGLKY